MMFPTRRMYMHAVGSYVYRWLSFSALPRIRFHWLSLSQSEGIVRRKKKKAMTVSQCTFGVCANRDRWELTGPLPSSWTARAVRTTQDRRNKNFQVPELLSYSARATNSPPRNLQQAGELATNVRVIQKEKMGGSASRRRSFALRVNSGWITNSKSSHKSEQLPKTNPFPTNLPDDSWKFLYHAVNFELNEWKARQDVALLFKRWDRWLLSVLFAVCFVACPEVPYLARLCGLLLAISVLNKGTKAGDEQFDCAINELIAHMELAQACKGYCVKYRVERAGYFLCDTNSFLEFSEKPADEKVYKSIV